MRAVALALFLILSAACAGAAAHFARVLEPPVGAASAATDDALGNWRAAVIAVRALGADVWEASKAASMEQLVETGAPIIENWIVTWRDRALAAGTQPMPRAIKEQLVGYFADTLLDRIRYRVGWADGRPMQSSLFRLLDARALALGRVIVFRDAGIAADPVIWAHELAHVQQYDRWGTREFAERYVRDHHAVETEAWEVAARYTMWALQEGKLARAAQAVPGRPGPIEVFIAWLYAGGSSTDRRSPASGDQHDCRYRHAIFVLYKLAGLASPCLHLGGGGCPHPPNPGHPSNRR